MKPRRVAILWRDNCDIAAGEWASLANLEAKPAVIESCGWLIDETTDAYLITHTLDRAGRAARGSFLILKCCVLEVIRLDPRH